MSDNALISLQDIGQSDATALAAVSTAGGFLPRLQLYGSNTKACKAGKIGIAHYGITRDKNDPDDLGKEVEVLVIAGRVKAMQFTDDAVIVNYDHKSAEYQRIAAASAEQDSGCMFGSEYLMWVPAAKTFVSFFMASATARRAAPKVVERLGKAATLSAEYIEKGKYAWHGPVCKPLDNPTFEIPDIEEIKKQANVFLNPKSSTMEKDTSDERDR